MNMKDVKFLNKDEVKALVPSAFAETPADKVSKKYTFVPTYRVIDDLDKLGWYPVQAHQQKANSVSGKDPEKMKHMIRFAKELSDVKVGGITPNLLWYNSHDLSYKSVFNLGCYRFICGNGMVVADSEFGGFSQKHMGLSFEALQQIVHQAVNEFDNIYSKIGDYQNIILPREKQIEFAQVAINANWGETSPISPNDVLNARRGDDQGDDLWKVFNRVQENMIKGGMKFRELSTNTGKVRKHATKPISNLVKDMSINKGLWKMMETYRATGNF